MFESEYELSLDEDNQIEQPANMYSIVKTLEFIVIYIYISNIYKRNGPLLLDTFRRKLT